MTSEPYHKVGRGGAGLSSPWAGKVAKADLMIGNFYSQQDIDAAKLEAVKVLNIL